MRGEDDPQLLLVAADTHRPALPMGMTMAAAPGQELARAPASGSLWAEHEAPNDLVRQRWAVIAPQGREGDALLARIEPLIAARAAEQGNPVKLYRTPPTLTPEAAARWKKQVFWSSEALRDDLPRFQLLLGDLHQVPPELQVSQATDGFVGRLAFDRLEHYEAYVEKLLAAERARPPGDARALLHTVHDGTEATAMGHRALMEPALQLLEQLRARGPRLFPASLRASDAGRASAPSDLLALARSVEPTALLSVSHGAGAPEGGWRSLAEQHARQGAMSFGADGELRGVDVARGAFLPGGVWFMLACFGAGTPAVSKYHRWIETLVAHHHFAGDPETVLRSLPRAGERPFVAGLPKAALANPRGPLAFIGHLDLAWTYSFREADGGRSHNRPGRFVDLLAALVRGDRVGVAFRDLFRYFEQVNVELCALDETGPADPLRRAHLWMLRQDLAGYVVLGDPAARLPAPRAEATRPAALDLGAEFGFAPLPTTAALGQPMSLDRLEQAIGHALVGAASIDDIARRYRLERSELERLVALYRAAGRAAIEGGSRG